MLPGAVGPEGRGGLWTPRQCGGSLFALELQAASSHGRCQRAELSICGHTMKWRLVTSMVLTAGQLSWEGTGGRKGKKGLKLQSHLNLRQPQAEVRVVYIFRWICYLLRISTTMKMGFKDLHWSCFFPVFK